MARFPSQDAQHFYQKKTHLIPQELQALGLSIHTSSDGNKPHACGLAHFFHILHPQNPAFRGRGLTSVSLTPIYELSGHMQSSF